MTRRCFFWRILRADRALATSHRPARPTRYGVPRIAKTPAQNSRNSAKARESQSKSSLEFHHASRPETQQVAQAQTPLAPRRCARSITSPAPSAPTPSSRTAPATTAGTSTPSWPCRWNPSPPEPRSARRGRAAGNGRDRPGRTGPTALTGLRSSHPEHPEPFHGDSSASCGGRDGRRPCAGRDPQGLLAGRAPARRRRRRLPRRRRVGHPRGPGLQRPGRRAEGALPGRPHDRSHRDGRLAGRGDPRQAQGLDQRHVRPGQEGPGRRGDLRRQHRRLRGRGPAQDAARCPA